MYTLHLDPPQQIFELSSSLPQPFAKARDLKENGVVEVDSRS